MPFEKVTSGLILFDDFAYSDGTLTTVGSSQWSAGAAVGNDVTDFQVVSERVETDPDDTSGTNMVAANLGTSYATICIGALVAADNNDENPTLTKFVQVGIIANGAADQPSDNYIAAYVLNDEFDQSERHLTLEHRLSGAIVSTVSTDISDKANFVGTVRRLKLYVENSVQEVYYDDESLISSTVTRNNGIEGLPGLYHGGNHFGGGFGAYDQKFACKGNTLTVGGLVTGYSAVINGKSETATSTGTVEIALAETWFPQSILEIQNGAGASIDTLDVSSEASTQRIFGADVFRWTAPPAGDPWTAPYSSGDRLPWWILWQAVDSDFTLGVDYALRVYEANPLRISAETARAHRVYDSVISKP